MFMINILTNLDENIYTWGDENFFPKIALELSATKIIIMIYKLQHVDL